MKLIVVISSIISAFIYMEYGILLFIAFAFMFFFNLYFLYKTQNILEFTRGTLKAIDDSRDAMIKSWNQQENYYKQQVDTIVKVLENADV